VSGAALADDAVAIRAVRARGVSAPAVRQQLAGVPVPATRRFIFVRRVVLRAAPARIGQAMTAALAELAGDQGPEVLTFADFPAVAVACARAALAGGLSGGVGGGWHWRALGLPATAGAGEAIARLLIGWPLQAGSVVAALAARGLLAPVWRDVSEPMALRVTEALAGTAAMPVPPWPSAAPPAPRAVGLPDFAAPLLARAAAIWAPVLRALPPRHEAIRTAAVLALLRFAPSVLRAGDSPVWPALLTRLAGRDAGAEPSAPQKARPDDPAGSPASAGASPEAVRPDDRAVAEAAKPAPAPEPTPPGATAIGTAASDRVHGETVATAWGGLLFLINVLRDLNVEALLDSSGPAAPTGWRLLLDLGVALGLPEDEPLAAWLAAQDLATATPPELLASLLDGIAARFAAEGPWPLPLAQPAVLRATETHLDVDLATPGIDIAVRLAGLDLDPGWVPWLGRIVAFHYPNLPVVFAWGG
jgi:hypothetical protein